MRKAFYVTLAALLVGVAARLYAQDHKAEIQSRLASQFTLTKTTADRTDIVTPGSTLVLHKDGLVMFSIDTKFPPTYTYKDGKLKMTLADSMALGLVGVTINQTPQRKFVAGEKFWITAYSVSDKNVILLGYSDPYGDTRYYGQIKFPFEKHNIPPADEVMKTIAEVVTAEPPDNITAGNSTQNPPSTETPQPAPKTIALGQTKDQVVAAFGQPQKAASIGDKEIYSYPDMKVTFVNGKVTNVE